MGLRIIETTVALIITVLLLTACISLDDRQTTSNELKKHAIIEGGVRSDFSWGADRYYTYRV